MPTVLGEHNAGAAPKSKTAKGGGKNKSIEQQYQKLSQHEHILKRPDTYIGSVEPLGDQEHYVLKGSAIISEKITMTPGLYKIFDEIVVNAADNKQRSGKKMTKLDIVVSQSDGYISVSNNGIGIPLAMHAEHDCYIPTLIFGHLLTGSNFDDEEAKTTGGRNGYGAKLTNIFSEKFIVECQTGGKRFHQVFEKNMTVVKEPSVTKVSAALAGKGDYVKITFYPDLPRFKMTHLDDDVLGLFQKRAYDVAATLGSSVKVTLNGDKLPVSNFQDYLGCFSGIIVPKAMHTEGDRWEVGVGSNNFGPDGGSSLKHISFVNGICTSQGGEHVNYIATQVVNHLTKICKKKNKGQVVPKSQIRNHLFVYVNCLIENPSFSSQTKEALTTKPKSFGSTCVLPPKFLKAVENSGVVTDVLALAQFKQSKSLKRMGGTKKSKLTGIVKLDDANHAGTAKSKDCTLILTEGDSAKSLAMSGLSVVGRDYYGVWPLKGKPLNVRDAGNAAVLKNEEIKTLVEILGLKFGTVYSEANIKTLRYGHLLIMADQDADGSHIAGLIINLIHYYWPSLLDCDGFLQRFITPIVKATKGKQSKTFFTVPEYEMWMESEQSKGFKIKYYKGLGTSTAAEAKEYFSDLDRHQVAFDQISKDTQTITIDGDADDDDLEFAEAQPDKVVSGTDLIDMLFSKARVEDRKQWLGAYKKDTFLDYAKASKSGVQFSDFVNKEFILFSHADNSRSIPHIFDGFKPSQRKILFGCFKRKLKGEIKVAQLAGYVSEHSAYHHGEQSLTETIIKMAQHFVGSNNVNLLTPSGQFGTRRMGGKDSASPRYVFTKLENICRKIFHPDDDALLNFLNDDGLPIEPEFYMPVIPMVLVNGSEGIGTGWSTSVPNFNPREIIANLRLLIAGEEQIPLKPYSSGFTGDIIAKEKPEGSYKVLGKIERIDDTTLSITELPLKTWTQAYKTTLETLMNGDAGKKLEPEIRDFKENHTDTTVAFTVIADEKWIDKFEKDSKGLMGKFKLTGSLSTSNMNLFDEHGHIVKYKNAETILQTFFDTRLNYYDRRKEHLLVILRREQLMLINKARFVEEVCDGTLIVSNRKRTELLYELDERNYDLMDSKVDEKKNDGSDDEEEDEEEHSDAELAKGFEYLLGMKIWSLTYEKAEQLRNQLAVKNEEVEVLEATEPSAIWLHDLDEIEIALDERDEAMAAAEKEEVKAQQKSKKNQTKRLKKAATKSKKKKADDWDSDEESDEDDMMLDDDDSDVNMPKKQAASRKAPVKKAAPVKKPALKKAVAKKAAPKDSEEDDPLFTKASARTAQPVKRQNDKKAPPPSDSESDDDVTMSLADRLAGKLMVSPPSKKTKPLTLSSQSSSADDDDEDDPFELDYDTFKPAALTPARKKAVPVKKAAAAKKQATKKPAAVKKPATKKKAPVKQALDFEESSEEEDDFDLGDSDEDEAPVAKRPAGGRARGKAITYAVDESSEEEDFDDDDESDFSE